MTLEHIIGSESKEVLKKKAQKKICQGEMVSQIKEFQVVKSETISALHATQSLSQPLSSVTAERKPPSTAGELMRMAVCANKTLFMSIETCFSYIFPVSQYILLFISD